MTKLITAVAVVQLVEQGILSLDEDVRESLPELKDIQILRGIEHGRLPFPLTMDRSNKRHTPLTSQYRRLSWISAAKA